MPPFGGKKRKYDFLRKNIKKRENTHIRPVCVCVFQKKPVVSSLTVTVKIWYNKVVWCGALVEEHTL